MYSKKKIYRKKGHLIEAFSLSFNIGLSCLLKNKKKNKHTPTQRSPHEQKISRKRREKKTWK